MTELKQQPKTLLSLTEEDRARLKALASHSGTTFTGLVRLLINIEYDAVFGKGDKNAN